MITDHAPLHQKKRNSRKLWLITGCLVGCSLYAAEREPIPPLTVERAVQLSLAHHPQLRVAEARRQAAHGRMIQAGRWSNPELELKAEEWPVSGGGNFSDAKHTIGISQTVPYPGKKRWDRQLALGDIQNESAQLALVKTDIERQTRAAFYKALAATNLVIVSAELLALAETSSASVRRQMEAGAATRQELLRVELYEEQTRAEHAALQQECVAARQALDTWLQDVQWQQAPLSGNLEETPAEDLLQIPFEQALTRHPAWLAAQLAETQAQHFQRRARLEPYPDVRFSLAGGRTGPAGESILELGITLPLPLWDRSKGRQLEAEAQSRAAAASVLVVRQELHRTWLAACQRYRTAIEQVRLHRERVLTKAEAALEAVRTAHQEGKIPLMDLLDTQRTVAQTRLLYQQKLLELALVQNELRALLFPHSLSKPAQPSIDVYEK